jgi:hypothetical protein
MEVVTAYFNAHSELLLGIATGKHENLSRDSQSPVRESNALSSKHETGLLTNEP